MLLQSGLELAENFQQYHMPPNSCSFPLGICTDEEAIRSKAGSKAL